jgi:hypothetical protein
VFADGPLAGRLRVHGDDDLGCHPAGPSHGVAVYAIPRRAVARQLNDSLVLHTTVSAARSRWLMHVTLRKGRDDPRPCTTGPACLPAIPSGQGDAGRVRTPESSSVQAACRLAAC